MKKNMRGQIKGNPSVKTHQGALKKKRAAGPKTASSSKHMARMPDGAQMYVRPGHSETTFGKGKKLHDLLPKDKPAHYKQAKSQGISPGKMGSMSGGAFSDAASLHYQVPKKPAKSKGRAPVKRLKKKGR